MADTDTEKSEVLSDSPSKLKADVSPAVLNHNGAGDLSDGETTSPTLEESTKEYSSKETETPNKMETEVTDVSAPSLGRDDNTGSIETVREKPMEVDALPVPEDEKSSAVTSQSPVKESSPVKVPSKSPSPTKELANKIDKAEDNEITEEKEEIKGKSPKKQKETKKVAPEAAAETPATPARKKRGAPRRDEQKEEEGEDELATKTRK